ncbi:MAG: class II aldolase/adducin family protein [Eggerthellaceae bacterium]|nr:class II aldolase/adducin family protein [Eggerthellaceae bacterium]
MDLQKTALQICTIGRMLYEKGLVAAEEGNISVRTGENEMLITPAGVCKGRMSPSMLLRCNLQGEVFESNAG